MCSCVTGLLSERATGMSQDVRDGQRRDESAKTWIPQNGTGR